MAIVCCIHGLCLGLAWLPPCSFSILLSFPASWGLQCTFVFTFIASFTVLASFIQKFGWKFSWLHKCYLLHVPTISIIWTSPWSVIGSISNLDFLHHGYRHLWVLEWLSNVNGIPESQFSMWPFTNSLPWVSSQRKILHFSTLESAKYAVFLILLVPSRHNLYGSDVKYLASI